MVRSDLDKYREWLLKQYNRSYALQIYSNSIKYQECLANPSRLSAIPISIRGNVLKAMANLAKFLGKYEEYKSRLKAYGIKWFSSDNSFSAFMSIISNSHSNIGQWYNTTQAVLSDNEKLYLKYLLLSGLRKDEGIKSFNLIIELARSGKLGEYFNEELGIIEHFRYPKLFLRRTKNVYISIVPRELIAQTASSRPVYYTTLRKRLERNKIKLRLKELRSYNNTFLRKNGLISELVDLIAGRIPKSVFARHYLKVSDIKELVQQVLTITSKLEESLTQ